MSDPHDRHPIQFYLPHAPNGEEPIDNCFGREFSDFASDPRRGRRALALLQHGELRGMADDWSGLGLVITSIGLNLIKTDPWLVAQRIPYHQSARRVARINTQTIPAIRRSGRWTRAARFLEHCVRAVFDHFP